MRAMTADTHAHGQSIELLDPIHRFDWPMTLLAFQSGRDMPAVVESYVVGQIVYLHPLDWLILTQSRRNLLNLGRVLEDLRVAIHTRARCRDPGHG